MKKKNHDELSHQSCETHNHNEELETCGCGHDHKKLSIFNEKLLMGVAILGAVLLGEWLEGLAVLAFYSVGEYLQNLAVKKSRRRITELMDIRPDTANLLAEGGVVTVSPEQVAVGDTVLVRPGEKIPLDGEILLGNTSIDTSALTGESLPRDAGPGDDVISGSLNLSGVIHVCVKKPFAESTVSKILELTQNAASKKAKSEQFITKFARVYTPVVLILALLIAFVPPTLGFDTYDVWIYRGLSLLIISCPCALIISIPLGFFAGIGSAAKRGILVKGGNYLEALSKMDSFIFDKTGTLTKGTFRVSAVIPAEGFDEQTLIDTAAIAEQHSLHPIAQSIMQYYNETPEEATAVELPGLGLDATYNGIQILAGNAKLMERNGIEVESTSQTVLHVARGGVYLGRIEIGDEVKGNARATITQLKEQGIRKVYMLTGDNDSVAKRVAQELNIDEYCAGLLPHEKVSKAEELLKAGRVAFVGDGINDAPVLNMCDIGIAMGGVGTDAAIEAADVVMMDDDLLKIPAAIRISKKTRRVVVQNIVMSLAFKVGIMALASFGVTSLWFAIFADVGVALLALLNALRVMRV